MRALYPLSALVSTEFNTDYSVVSIEVVANTESEKG